MKSISPVHFIDKLVKKNTVEEDLRELNEQNDVVEIFADPYQMHRSITTLQAAGVADQGICADPSQLHADGSNAFRSSDRAQSRSVPFRRTEAAGAIDRGR